jgi:A/G-specific adenine glycosylase
MDLGATICTPKKPACALCPWSEICQAYLVGDMEMFPIRTPKKPKPTRYASVFWLLDGRGKVFIRRREEKGLLGGMMEFPSSDWVVGQWQKKEALDYAPAVIDWQILDGKIRHTFTHFHLELRVLKGVQKDGAALDGIWCEIDQLGNYALPTVMKKVSAHATRE